MQPPSRCPWTNNNLLMIDYHDKEWGVPVHDNYKHFEFIILDAFQAGLSWQTIINKRENFRKAFDGFDFEKIARYDEKEYLRLMNDSGIIRNRMKIQATIANAKAFNNIRKEYGSFDKYIWQFTKYQTIKNNWKNIGEVPARSRESDMMSKDLIRRGFKFVGSTICYAYMQAAGMVNDHLTECFRYHEVAL